MQGVVGQLSLYGHLVAVFLVLTATRLVSGTILLFYKLFPAKWLLDWVYSKSHALRHMFTFHLSTAAVPEDSPLSWDVEKMAAAAGFRAEHHCVTTKDGFILCVHRIVRPEARLASVSQRAGAGTSAASLPDTASPAPCTANPRRGPDAEDPKVGYPDTRSCAVDTGKPTPAPLQPSPLPSPGGRGAPRPVVLCMHGLMQSSEAFVVGGRTRALAFALADAGFDVWLGNNRGNKYSGKHLRLKPTQEEYWDFSFDELARFDVPAMVEYIVEFTDAPKISYVGFSQGTAQCFAALATQPRLAARISSFCALAPAVSVRGLSQSFMTSLVEANLDFLFLLFGRRAMLPSSHTWAQILDPALFVKVIDVSVRFLFGWDMSSVSKDRRAMLYHHLYSYSSTKSVAHWMQLMRRGTFGMFSDAAPSQHRVTPSYDVGAIRVPMAIFVGDRDGVIDPERLLRLLPASTEVHRVPNYEHLCFLWADDAPNMVFPSVEAFLSKHTHSHSDALVTNRL